MGLPENANSDEIIAAIVDIEEKRTAATERADALQLEIDEGKAGDAVPAGVPIDPDLMADAVGNVIALRGHRGGLRLGEPGGEAFSDFAGWLCDAYHRHAQLRATPATPKPEPETAET